jgi:hypothetical protein
VKGSFGHVGFGFASPPFCSSAPSAYGLMLEQLECRREEEKKDGEI